MKKSTKHIINHLKQNPQFIGELNETMADAICHLVINHQTGDFEEREIIDKLASLRLELRKLASV